MPVYRQPLRLKRKVDLKIVTSISTKVDKAPIPLDGHFMYTSEFQRGRINSRLANIEPEGVSLTVCRDSSEASAAHPPKSTSNVLKAFYDFIPFVSIALADGAYDPVTVQPPPSDEPLSPTHSVPFTHVLRILYSCASADIGIPLEGGMSWPQYDETTGVAVLNLVIPEQDGDEGVLPKGEKKQKAMERKLTLLSENQLLLARDFLCLALPFYKEGDWRPSNAATPDAVHVLITAPWCHQSKSNEENQGVLRSSISTSKTIRQETESAVDVLSIAACYLAQCSKRRVKQVLGGIDIDLRINEQQGKDSQLWMDRVGKEGWSLLDRIATLG